MRHAVRKCTREQPPLKIAKLSNIGVASQISPKYEIKKILEDCISSKIYDKSTKTKNLRFPIEAHGILKTFYDKEIGNIPVEKRKLVHCCKCSKTAICQGRDHFFDEHFDFWRKYWFLMTILIFLAKILIFDENIDFWWQFWFLDENFDFWRKFWFLTKILIFDDNFDFLTKILIFDENIDFWWQFWFLTKILIFDENFDFSIISFSVLNFHVGQQMFDGNFDFWAKIPFSQIVSFLLEWLLHISLLLPTMLCRYKTRIIREHFL